MHRFSRNAGPLPVCALTLLSAWLPGAAFAQPLTATGVQLVTGSPTFLLPSATLANLDAGDLVAGNTRWDHDGDGIIFNETFGGFLWSPGDGAQVFDISDDLYYQANRHLPHGIADNRTVVGTDLFTSIGQVASRPFAFTPRAGFQFLPLPRSRPSVAAHNFGAIDRAVDSVDYNGEAVAISDDGSVAVGTIQQGIFSDVEMHAVMWTLRLRGRHLKTRLHPLDTTDASSHALDVSADGSVIVGDSGPDGASLQAARWIDGAPQQLDPVGSSSRASFASADGSAAIGSATVGAVDVLVRWDPNGVALVADPPLGTTIGDIRAINPTATAAVGSLIVLDAPYTPFGQHAPFVWTLSNGFTMLPELGREEDYDLSEALDVSDDGNLVVGTLQASTVFNGDPPTLGWIWVNGSGLFTVDDILTNSGLADIGIYRVDAIAGDGSRVLATGNPPRTDQDTNSVIIRLAPTP